MSLEELAITAAKQAGQLLAEMQDSINPREKAPKDLVTEADVASQKRILEILTASGQRTISWERKICQKRPICLDWIGPLVPGRT